MDVSTRVVLQGEKVAAAQPGETGALGDTFDNYLTDLTDLPDGVSENDLREAFSLFDPDGSGCISTAELQALLNAIGVTATAAEVADIVNEVDYDGSGQVNSSRYSPLLEANQLYVTPTLTPDGGPFSFERLSSANSSN